ncbi:fluoride efflux transporter CrcB [Pyruvatibacter mobilis]|jgi:CrcB protein|uniref:Fluoride-specific ion channel FluC n=2 Tax=Pyruvatibacter mobilis TaxID=1712261 RepID=A0A845QAN8_9HYPH|nr:fluoride efflux transporter CrcB [Pyruvatibacter mobilis]NBG95705.1 fluoride efflux transporter CrcB [Pyruvatibacter mobilis]QJD74858.1 fluoride efflux transporter CrcB [Pyruvatibacter mobilis]GGD10671.1 putative fluoride ion transporter CrcB [Pyruvatibacter mobilis]
MNMVLAIALGGGLGAVGRYAVGAGALALMGPGFPFGTLAANVVGGFLMGAVVEAGALKFSYSPELRAFLTVGLLGGFTTFSAFSLESALMIQRGEWALAFGYVAMSALFSIGALFCGLWLMRGVLS